MTNFNLSLRPEFSKADLPSSFDFSFDINQENIDEMTKEFISIEKSFFNQHCERDSASVQRLLESYKLFESFGFSHCKKVVPASSSILKTISGSESLLKMAKEMELKFTIDSNCVADLMEVDDITNLSEIVESFSTLKMAHEDPLMNAMMRSKLVFRTADM